MGIGSWVFCKLHRMHELGAQLGPIGPALKATLRNAPKFFKNKKYCKITQCVLNFAARTNFLTARGQIYKLSSFINDQRNF